MTAKQAQAMTIEPSNEITFHGPYTDVVESTLKLHNTNDKPMAFKVKTTAPKQYCVRPNSGFIEPNESRSVVVMLQPLTNPTVAAESPRHKFLVQTCYVDSTTERNIDEIWRDLATGQLMDSKLRVMFDPPVTGTAAVSLPSSPSNAADHDDTMNTAVTSKTRKPDAAAADSGELRRTKEQLLRAQDEVSKLKQIAMRATSGTKSSMEESGVPTWQLAVLALIALIVGVILGKMVL